MARLPRQQHQQGRGGSDFDWLGRGVCSRRDFWAFSHETAVTGTNINKEFDDPIAVLVALKTVK